ncbi:sialidase family protein [Ramlibacter rhizophilus]|uniref:Exo-alpha-sialidase n=1 Tax=Ramlibacter rhizophilus TaxID=1781167 RepID=A0A4Z0BZH0_9BURK|nr:sialidase family protein [Ramlibacter rhizophilus]TFZ03405.1 exo-alpha-sialidase [Ramlibacter rhizophilus]
MLSISSRPRASALVAGAWVGTWIVAGAAAVLPAQAEVPISGLSPYLVDGSESDFAAVTRCNGAPQAGNLFRNSESEPHLAVNPVNRANMISSWHQDRWSSGGAQGLGAAYTIDGGTTWQPVTIPFTRCSGAQARSSGDYERASDPWVSFGPDGTAYLMGLVTDNSVNENAMVVARSSDDGVSWSAPVVIVRSPAQDPTLRSLFHDKNSITADPFDPNYVYATWTVFRLRSWSVMFSRSTDKGLSWSAPRPIATLNVEQPPEQAYFRQGAQVIVLRDVGGNPTLLNVYYRLVFNPRTGEERTEQSVLRSTDQGKSWSRVDLPIATFRGATAVDIERGIPVRDAGTLPSAAANPTTGYAYVAWQARRSDGRVGVNISVSSDGGRQWSAPVRVNQGSAEDVQAFLPIVAVNQDGTVGVLFYDFRNDQPGDPSLSTDVWLSVFTPELGFVREWRLTSSSFDMRMSALTQRGYFPGDYVGLASDGEDFVAAFTRTNNVGTPAAWPPGSGVVDPRDRQSIVFARQAP